MTADPPPPSPPDPPEGETWVLTFRVMPGDVPAGRRVARLLKLAGRQMGLRCLSVTSRDPDQWLREELDRVRELLGRAEAKLRRKAKAKTGGKG